MPKLRITLKDPDGINEAIDDFVKANRPTGLSDEEWEDIREERASKLRHSKFIEYGDYVSVEIDVDAGTAIVLPVK